MKIKPLIFVIVSVLVPVVLLINTLINPVPVNSQSASPKGKTSPSPSPTPTPIVPSDVPPSGINLTLSPTFINLVTSPGESVSSQLKIRNNNNYREYLQFNVASFTAEGENGDSPVLKEVGPKDDFVNWISFSDKQFTVDPNEQKTVKFTINPPKEAALGYYYAIMVQRIKEQTPGENQTIIAGAPAFLAILEVRSPNMKRELTLEDFRTTSPIYEYLPSTFEMTFKNTGNIHVVPAGDIFIDWGSEKNVGVIHSNEFNGNILPQTKRTYRATWDDGFITRVPKKDEKGNTISNQKGEIEYETKWDFNKLTKFRIGKYTAHVVAVYDNGQRDIPLEGTVSFWVIPWKILGGGLLVLIIILFGVKSIISSITGSSRRR